MHIVQIYHSKVPVAKYGGMERVIESLCEGFVELGHKVTLIAYQGDYAIKGINAIHLDSLSKHEAENDFVKLIPSDADVVHFHIPRALTNFPFPHLFTMHGNSDQPLHENTYFISRKHAENHKSTKFIYNGLNPQTIKLSSKKLNQRDYFAFLGRSSLKRKGLSDAKKIARTLKTRLIVGGGLGIPWRGVSYLGQVDNSEKSELLQQAKALLFPISWEEPFGLVQIEALFCGTPVFAYSRGSVDEVLKQEPNSFNLVANNYEELISKIKNYTYSFDPEEIRNYGIKYFGHIKMCEGYLHEYQTLIQNR